MTDFYELTMSAGYLDEGYQDKYAVFDMFFRRVPDGGGYAIMAGLQQFMDAVDHLKFIKEDIDYLRSTGVFNEQFLDYLSNFQLHCNIWAIEEGVPIFPHEPIVTVEGPAIECQAAGNAAAGHFQSPVSDRHQGQPYLPCGRRGARSWSSVPAAPRAMTPPISVPVRPTSVAAAPPPASWRPGTSASPASGTMAHSWVQMFPTEYDAFKKYAELYPDACVLLVDTYNVLRHGVPDCHPRL